MVSVWQLSGVVLWGVTSPRYWAHCPPIHSWYSPVIVLTSDNVATPETLLVLSRGGHPWHPQPAGGCHPANGKWASHLSSHNSDLRDSHEYKCGMCTFYKRHSSMEKELVYTRMSLKSWLWTVSAGSPIACKNVKNILVHSHSYSFLRERCLKPRKQRLLPVDKKMMC